MRYAVIMAGGSGTRLWPLSRSGEPKQLLTLFGGDGGSGADAGADQGEAPYSLLQLAWRRIVRLIPAERILVCTGAKFADQVAQQLPDLRPENLLGEPEGRDSLNAVAWTAAFLEARDPEASVVVLTSDHIIEPIDVFISCIEAGFALTEAQPDRLVTFGVVPASAHTGYGYLHRGVPIAGFGGACEVVEFKEKPDEPTAKTYLASGEYWWNSGMFVWRAATLMAQLELLRPATASLVRTIVAEPSRLSELFGTLEKTSIDYAIMEPVSRGMGSARVAAVPLPVDWRDVGSFAELAAVLPPDDDGNAVRGRVVIHGEVSGCLLINTDPTAVLAVADVSDMAVVRTPEGTLAIPLASSQLVKTIAEQVIQSL
jgi:mannose-1-phosphate guanylyltransferase